MGKQFVISIVIFLALIIATIMVVIYGKGYRFGLGDGKIAFNGTGLLVAKSLPDSASVFVNGKLKTATSNTINLAPGVYDVKIIKQGYFPWEKTIKIQTEAVSQANALLIPSAPKLENITDIGAIDPIIDPTLTKIAFVVASQSSKINGIYVFDMKSTPLLTLQSASTQIVDDSYDKFSQSKITWSPDGKDLIATVSGTPGISNTYLLDTDQPNTPPNNVTENLSAVEASWAKIRLTKKRAELGSIPTKTRKLVINNFNVLAYSPDQNKILYEASVSATLPIIIKPRLIGANSTLEQRTVTKGSIYVYDVKEDRNYPMDLKNFQGAYSWFTDSGHFIFVRDNELHIMEFDGINDTIVYAGPFISNYVFPWPDATKIVVLTNLGNRNITPNLYTISLK